MSQGFHSRWRRGTATERAAFDTTGLYSPWLWWETDSMDILLWISTAWRTLAVLEKAQTFAADQTFPNVYVPDGGIVGVDGGASWTFDDTDGLIEATNAYLSNQSLSSALQEQLFSEADGLLLLGPGCEIAETAWTSLRGQEATIAGAFHQVAGRWSGTRALIVSPAETNRVNNPIAYNNVTDSWTTGAGGGSGASRDTTRAFEGEASFELAAGDSSNSVMTSDSYSLADGLTIIVQCRLFRDADTGASLVVRDTTNNSNRATTSATKIGQWELLEAEWTNDTGGAVDVAVRVLNTEGDNSSEIWFDAVMMTQRDYSVRFFHGDSGPGYTWAGTAHNSNSSKAATEVNLDDYAKLFSGQNQVSISIWAQMAYDYDATWHAAYPRLFSVFGNGSNRIDIMRGASSSKFRVRVNGTDPLIANSGDTAQKGDWIHIVVALDFDADEYYLYENGVEIASSTDSYSAPTGLTQMCFGSSYDGSSPWGGAIAETALFTSTLTAEEVAALYQRNAPLVDGGAFDAPGVYILDGQFLLATSTADERTEIDDTGWYAYNESGSGVFALSLVNFLSWGGFTLDKADVALGRSDVDYLRWDDSTEELSGEMTDLEVANLTTGGRIVNTTRVTAAYTALSSDYMIYADTDGGAFTITLPAGVEGQYFRIANVGTSGNTLTIDGDGAETVAGEATQEVYDGEVLILIYNATEGWY